MAEYLLEAQHLRKAFEDKTVLQDVSLGVRRGEVVVVVGPSGCGKSTLLRCLNGLESVDGGEILLEGPGGRRVITCPDALLTQRGIQEGDAVQLLADGTLQKLP